MNRNDGRYTETDRLPPIRHESSKKDIPSPAPSAAPRATIPHPANLDLFPYEASARPVAGLAVDYEDGHRVRRHRHRRAQLLYAISGVMVVETEAGIWVVPPTRGVWVPAWVAHGIRMSGEPRMRTVFVEPGAAAHLPTQCVLSISPLLRELMAAATEVPLDWQPGTRDGRLMMLLLDELRQEPVLPLHLPQPAEPRLARICRAIVRHPEGRTAWPTGPLNWGGSQDGAAPVPAPYRHDLRPLAQQRGCWRRWNGWRAASGCWTWRWTWATSPSAFAAMFRKALGEPPSAFAARGRRPPEDCGTGAGIRAQAARTWPEVSANLARGAPPGMSPARWRGTGVLFSVSPAR